MRVVARPQQDLFTRMETAGQECGSAIFQSLTDIITKTGMETPYGSNEAFKNLGHTFERDLPELEIPNEDWNGNLRYGHHTFAQGPVSEAEGKRVVKEEFAKILRRVKEGDDYECDRIWGREGPEPLPRGASLGERLGEKLFEPFRQSQEEFLNQFPAELRERENFRCKRAVESALTQFDLCVKSKVPELR